MGIPRQICKRYANKEVFTWICLEENFFPFCTFLALYRGLNCDIIAYCSNQRDKLWDGCLFFGRFLFCHTSCLRPLSVSR